MAHWKLTLSYDGTAFHGWQVQPGLRTVQSTLSDVLFHLTGERVLPQGSGRTDAGVHALAQVASFTLSTPIPPPNLLRAANRALPASIRVLSAEEVPPDFHARHSSTGKAYEYRIFARDSGAICSPFLAPFVWDCPFPLSLEPMECAATYFLGSHDFTSFAASDPDLAQRSAAEPNAHNPVKTIRASEMTREGDLLLYRVSGSGFLHHMVRNIVGTLVDVGRGALSPNHIPNILAAHSRSAAGPTAPPQGLFLVSVNYG